MIIKIRKCSTKKLIKNSEKILRVLWEENNQFLSLIVFCKLIVFEKKIIEDQYLAIFSN